VLQYRKRINNIPDLQALANVARDILGLPGSSASVKRLGSQAGLMATRKRGSLSPDMLVKQPSFKQCGLEGRYVIGLMQADVAANVETIVLD
jgi:hypothetical protein